MSSLIAEIAASLKREAESGVNDDNEEEALKYLARCTVDVAAEAHKGVRLIYSRAIHEGEYFLHLSMTFRRPPYTAPAAFDHRIAKRAAPIFFHPHQADVIVYAPQTTEGKFWQAWSFRLFTSKDWKPSGYVPLYVPDGPLCFTWAEYERAHFQ